MKSIRIITQDSQGLINDAKTYEKVLKKNNFNVYIDILENFGNIKTKRDYCDLNLHLENIYDINMFPSKINLFMPNQELFVYKSFQLINKMNYVLCKTKVALEYFKSLKQEYNFKYVCFYTKFTTNISDDLKIKQINIKKNVNLFCHLAGKSPSKNTSPLIYCWIKNNFFFDYDKDIELHITCYKKCFDDTMLYLKSDFKYDFKYNEVNNIINIKNMFIYTKPIDIDKYKYIIQSSNVAICPSYKEGYGHYINEARYFNTYIITVDMPPMNELVDSSSSYIIKKFKKEKNTKINSKYELFNIYVDIDALRDAIIFCIKNKNDLYNISKSYRSMFTYDRKYFNYKMNKIINSYLIKKL